jgi:aminopeptidase N
VTTDDFVRAMEAANGVDLAGSSGAGTTRPARRSALKEALASRLEQDFLAQYHAMRMDSEYRPEPRQIGARALRNACLSYLTALDTAEHRRLAAGQFEASNNMTDRLAALQALAATQSKERDRTLDSFYQAWQSEPLIVNKWFSVQATSPATDTLARVREPHPAPRL